MEFCKTEYRVADQEYKLCVRRLERREECLKQVLCSRRVFFCAYEFIME